MYILCRIYIVFGVKSGVGRSIPAARPTPHFCNQPTNITIDPKFSKIKARMLHVEDYAESTHGIVSFQFYGFIEAEMEVILIFCGK